jgi:superfamily II DNA or RNA helicase
MPLYRNKIWNGKVYLFSYQTRLIYKGLIAQIRLFAKERNYDFSHVEHIENFDEIRFENLISEIKEEFDKRDYQIQSVKHTIQSRRNLILSPTSSGKSLMMFILHRYLNLKTLIIVPTTTLIHQLTDDFNSYSDIKEEVHHIFSGQERFTDKRITIGTWQSIVKMQKENLSSYDIVIADECHLAKSKSITSILLKMTNCKYRFGFTGTLDGSETHKLVLEGLFGAVLKTISTKEMMDAGYSATGVVKGIILKHDEETRKKNSKNTYQEEVEFLVNNTKRNIFIKKLILNLKGNTLVLFKHIDHGKMIFDMLKDHQNVYYIDGSIKGDKRNEIRKRIENEDNVKLIASTGTTDTGISIKKLHNIVDVMQTKARIKVLQAFGRGLRKHHTKNGSVYYTIADDLRYKSKTNYTLNHFKERIKYYSEEGIEWKIYEVDL